MKSPSDTVGATCFTFQPPGIASTNGAVNPKWCFYMRHGDNSAFRWAHLLMPGAVREGVVYGVIPAGSAYTKDYDDLVDGGRFYHCDLQAGGQIFCTMLWARDLTELRKVCRHIGAVVSCYDVANRGDYPSRWQRIKCVLRYFWLRRPTIKLRSPVTP
jgi:hypothetical protein